jgi:hypothetical protein
MRRRIAALVGAAFVFTITMAPTANAGLNAEIDLTNPRVVPVYNSRSESPPTVGDQAGYSAFLYSSRIVFSAAHSEYSFDNDGNKINFNPYISFVGKPNTAAGDYSGVVRVEKKFISKTFRFDGATLGDFVVYVLEKDLIPAPPVKLMTPELEKEIRESKTPIKMHGYGEHLDRCVEGEKRPCSFKYKRTSLPRTLTTVLRTLEEAENIVGYKRPQLSDSLIMNNGMTGFGCGGDSGGPVTTTYKGDFIYISTTPNGMNGFACGASPGDDGKGGINYASAVYKHLDIIKEAEEYVAAAIARETAAKVAQAVPSPTPKPSQVAQPKAKKTVTCAKGKTSKKISTANLKCKGK